MRNVSAISYQLSAISYQLSAISYQLSAISARDRVQLMGYLIALVACATGRFCTQTHAP
ncbi:MULTISPECIES: hypothetical protein [unclassified Moorena]|uniref:hypothetical protein n=1 Tax=unclassified Moorena TaxID=2683338 RepID=UPI00257AB9DF|nr:MULTISPECIES: hypothetical protein [unclassified Moorena]